MQSSYPGGKGLCYQKLINLMPPHEVYIETHLGSGAVMKAKRPAASNIGIDLDAAVIETARACIANSDDVSWIFYNEDALRCLKEYRFEGNELVYADPPYLMETRSCQKRYYRYEYEEIDHIALLAELKKLPCMVMVSGYQSELYQDMLSGWQTESFEMQTRGGSMATEWVWMNYASPVALHDYRFLGDNFRERERIKRKTTRWVEKLKQMSILERQALLAALMACQEPDDPGGTSCLIQREKTIPIYKR